jgi:hypothetical protein
MVWTGTTVPLYTYVNEQSFLQFHSIIIIIIIIINTACTNTVSHKFVTRLQYWKSIQGTSDYDNQSRGAESFWASNRYSCRQEILHILWDPKIHNRVRNIPPHDHIILPMQVIPSFTFPHQNPVWVSLHSHMCHTPHSSHFLVFNNPDNN